MNIKNERYRQKYHIMPPQGWMNDPNGLCFFKGYYHVFFQYHPYSSKWGPMHWGHYRSLDLVHWENCGIALKPDNDEDGCFSGSAVVKDNKMYLFYTGQHYIAGSNEKKFFQDQNVAMSEDGVHFVKYSGNPVIPIPPSDNSADFRDPKVRWKNNKWEMVLGSQDMEGHGRAILYYSDDLFNWDYSGVLAEARTDQNEGYVWECPDLFEIDGKQFLLTSPQGIQKENWKYKNLYQTGYFVFNENDRSSFHELDSGHDFYAAQTFLIEGNRRIMFAWMDMWEADMQEQNDGWSGTLTIPRDLKIEENHLFSYPIPELKNLRKKILLAQSKICKEVDFSSLSRQLEINVKVNWNNLKDNIVTFDLLDSNDVYLIELLFDKESGLAYLKRNGKDGKRQVRINTTKVLKIKIYVDTSSIEFFINNGESTFSERYYTETNPKFRINSNLSEKIDVTTYELSSSLIKDK